MPTKPASTKPLEAPEWLTPDEVAKLFGVHRGTIRRWTVAGLLPQVKIGNWWVRYRREDVERLLNGGD